MTRSIGIAALCWSLLFTPVSSTARAETLIVFAAQSLAEVMTDIADGFTAQSGTRVQLSLGASSTMARQIEARAPANIFISANRQWVDYLDERGALVSDSIIDVASNQLVLISGKDWDGTAISDDLANLTIALGNERLALANPAHVPAGIYAQAALIDKGIWADLTDNLAPAANVRAALRFVEQGAAPLGIVYATDALVSAETIVLHTFDDGSHQQILYPAAITAEFDGAAARDFLSYLQGKAAADVLRDHGFIPLSGDRG